MPHRLFRGGYSRPGSKAASKPRSVNQATVAVMRCGRDLLPFTEPPDVVNQTCHLIGRERCVVAR
jgi:hypothetical protein